MKTIDSEEAYSVKDLMRILDASRNTVSSMLKGKQIDSIRIGKRFFVLKSHLDKFKENGDGS